MMKALILAAMLCGLAAGAAQAGRKPGASPGIGLGGHGGLAAQTQMATAGGQVTSHGSRAGTGDSNRGAQGQGRSGTSGGHHR